MGIFTLGLGLACAADKDAKPTAYVATMTGVTWKGCQKYVSSALKQKFNATSIIITKGDKPKTQKVVFSCAKANLTKKEAADSMGDKKSRFVVTALKKSKASG